MEKNENTKVFISIMLELTSENVDKLFNKIYMDMGIEPPQPLKIKFTIRSPTLTVKNKKRKIKLGRKI